MQIPYSISSDISIYMESVEKNSGSFLIIREQCPLCGGRDCAVRIGFYYRKEVIISFRTYHGLPIARYLCHEKGDEKYPHKTFSLLPYQLIPYRKHGPDLMAETLRHLHQEDLTPNQTKEAISIMGKNEAIEFSDHQFHDFGEIFEQAFAKLNAAPQLKDLLHQQGSFLSYDPVGAVLDFGDHYQTPFPDQSRGQVYH